MVVNCRAVSPHTASLSNLILKCAVCCCCYAHAQVQRYKGISVAGNALKSIHMPVGPTLHAGSSKHHIHAVWENYLRHVEPCIVPPHSR